ncbi:MAG: tetratricopeptide repeat protein, partial [Prochlorococcus sp.]
LKDYQSAIADYNKAIAINPQHALAYTNRGIAKELVKDLEGACADWRKAAALGNRDAARWVSKQC